MTIRIPIAVSARHAHLSQETIDQVFGVGYQLRPRTWLSQTGQFAAQETVTLIGPKGQLRNVRVMGPPERAIRSRRLARTSSSSVWKHPCASQGISLARLALLCKGRRVAAS